MHKEHRQGHKTYRRRRMSCRRQISRGEREDSEWVMNEAVLWRTQTFDLENGTICFLFSTSWSHIGSDIEKRKTPRAQSKSLLRLRKTCSRNAHLPLIRRSNLFDPRSCVRSFLVLSEANLALRLLPPVIRSGKNPVEKTLKGTKKARLHCHISTCSLASSR